ncbi:MAG: T9SS type A sorting domain-containing protein [Saprospiraceae bacterium]|nr:T9SS type A sorting domain-containing protein [Saprospiraceae bacterium]
MIKRLLSAIVFITGMHVAQAQPTFAKDISPIIYNNCTNCHRTGEIGPFPLTSYEEVQQKSNLIKYVTEIRYMPPWKADPDYSHLMGSTALSEEEIDLIGEWVDAGAPLGDPAEEALMPEFPDGSLLGEPDLVLEFEEEHLHPGNNKDEYRYFVIPTGLTEDKVLKAIELRPGNKKIVHHCLFFEDTRGLAARADADTPEYGFDAFNNNAGFGVEQVLNNNQYPGYVPGQKPRFYPDGLGQKLTAGSDLVIQMHYAPWPVDEVDKSTINIFFADENETVDRFVEDHVMVPLPGVLVNGPFIIQANTRKTFIGEWRIPKDISLIGISPHMHLLGQDWEVYLEDNDGNKTNMISIPDWDFNWQGMYYFPKMVVAKKGWKVVAKATYDNTSNNPFNPNNPPQFVTWGEGTEDEMYYLPLLYVDYRAGDENIVFDSTYMEPEEEFEFPENKIYPISPNPVNDQMVSISFGLSHAKPVTISILDISGQLVRIIRKNEFFQMGKHIVPLNPSGLEPGIYIVNIQGNEVNLSQKFIKTQY